METIIELSGVAKSYGSTPALRGADAEVQAGSTALVGANGAGKTTLLKLLLGFLAPDGGSIRVFGRSLPAQARVVREKVGYMPEGDCLPGDSPAAEFVGLMAQLGGLPPRHARERASELLWQVGLGEERHRPIGGFSTGMKQRVKLAQALVHGPELVLLDEPTDGMDPTGRSEMLELIDRLRRELGVSVLLSTHLLGDVERVCERAVILDAGRILVHGSLEELAGDAEPLFELDLHDNGQPVREELERRGLIVSGSNGSGLVVRGTGVPRLVRDLAAERSWPLRRLVKRRRSLEDVYLRLQRAESQAE